MKKLFLYVLFVLMFVFQQNAYSGPIKNFSAFYDSGGSIGKRYRRQDEAGTPFGITIDHDTLSDNTVTLRNRDTMQQSRIAIDRINDVINDLIDSTQLSC